MTSDTRDAFLRLSTQKALVLLFQAQGQNLQASQLGRRQARESWEAPAEAEPLRALSYGMSWVRWHGGSFQIPKAEFISTPQSLTQVPKTSLHGLGNVPDKMILQQFPGSPGPDTQISVRSVRASLPSLGPVSEKGRSGSGGRGAKEGLSVSDKVFISCLTPENPTQDKEFNRFQMLL